MFPDFIHVSFLDTTTMPNMKVYKVIETYRNNNKKIAPNSAIATLITYQVTSHQVTLQVQRYNVYLAELGSALPWICCSTTFRLMVLITLSYMLLKTTVMAPVEMDTISYLETKSQLKQKNPYCERPILTSYSSAEENSLPMVSSWILRVRGYDELQMYGCNIFLYHTHTPQKQLT